MDVCGPVVRYMGQVKAGVSHTGNRFSEPVAIARGLGAGVFVSIATNLLGKGLGRTEPSRRNCKAGRQSDYDCCDQPDRNLRLIRGRDPQIEDGAFRGHGARTLASCENAIFFQTSAKRIFAGVFPYSPAALRLAVASTETKVAGKAARSIQSMEGMMTSGEMSTAEALEGKAVIVTGAGRGIGREIALLAAAEGAKVVVNDLGGAADGSGKSSGPVEEVVELIRQKGGTAVPNFDTVAEPSAAAMIVKTALDHFGKLDGVVNNAGILRDAIFHKMSVADFELVIKVHLLGSFYVSHAAARLFREQGSGVFVHFTSTSGLVGNFGQANYAAAKLGIVGLSKSIALDMARFNVRSNCVSPFAWSRLIGTIPMNTEEEKARVARIQAMGPEKIAPLSVFLLSDQAKDVTGQIFAVRMNEIFLMSQSRPIRSVHRSEGWTCRSITEHGMPALKASFYPLDRSADVFCWDAM